MEHFSGYIEVVPPRRNTVSLFVFILSIRYIIYIKKLFIRYFKSDGILIILIITVYLEKSWIS